MTVPAAAGSTPRRRAFLAYNAMLGLASVAVLISHLDQIVGAVPHNPALWMMTGLALLAGTQAIVTPAGPAGRFMIICPTMCFTFAILLCWGLGPAVVAQAGAVAVVAWRVRQPILEAFTTKGEYTVAFAAASVVLWLGKPDPFERSGPTNILLDAVSVVAAIAAWLLTYGLLAFIGARLARGRGPRQATRSVGNQVLFIAALLVLSPVLAFAAHVNIAFVPLIFIPLHAVQRMARLSAERDVVTRVDPLTGLANRTWLKSSFDRLAADRTAAGRRTVSLLVLDLDRFKQVNDALGHDVGDRLLVAVANRLARVAPDVDTVARLGGDEFAILAVTDDPQRLAQTVLDVLAEPMLLDGLRVDVTASVGIAIHPGGVDDFAVLMRHADVAMYEAKQHGDAIATYNPQSDRNSPQQLAVLADLREALEDRHSGQIAMHYQPQVSLVTGQIEGVEALLRWQHPTLGAVSAPSVLSLVEHTPVMQLLTTRVIDDVTAQVATWAAAGLALRASINISARDLYSERIVEHLAERLAYHRVRPGQLQIEVTESALLAEPHRAHAPLARLAELGVSIALDDFGTGYSSLQHLRKLPISEIKIDKSFVAGMAHNRDDAAIVRSTVDLARSLDLRTVAEGVETDYTRQLLTDAGCTLAQGWLTAHPMPGVDVMPWLERYLRARARPVSTVHLASPRRPR